MLIISPSLLAADFANLESELKKIKNSGAEWVHLDVMDGHFVPNMSFGAPLISSIRKKTDLFFDVHLMISNPLKYIKDYADAGADMITFHLESDSPIKETVDKIHSFGVKAGISLKPNTQAEKILPYINDIDMVLVMTVEPGFGGQEFMEEMIPKIKKIREYSSSIDIQVDGGINHFTAKSAINSGANVLVAGSAIFNSDDMGESIRSLRCE